MALELERIALNDDYFIEKKLYPNIDFYSGITLKALGFPTDMFTVLFAIARTVGWIAQWKEMIEDPVAAHRQAAPALYRRDRAQLRPDRGALRDQAAGWRPRSFGVSEHDPGRASARGLALLPHELLYARQAL